MKTLSLRNIINIALMVFGLAFLPACDWLKKKGCKDCGTESSNLSGQALLTSNGNVLETADSFEEDFWKPYLESVDPQTKMYLEFVPNMREQMFKQMVPMDVALLWLEKEGKKDAKFNDKLKRQCKLFEKGLALQAMREDLLKEINKSDEAVEKFYNENRHKMPQLFNRPPFVKVPASVEVQIVEFDKEEAAKDFAEKAKAPGADFAALAKEAKKTVKNLGYITPESKNVDASVKMRASNLEVGDVAKVNIGKDKFAVIKATNKKEAEFAPFSEIKSNKEVRDFLDQAMEETQLQDLFAKKLEDLKKKYNVVENTAFFEEERKAKEAKAKQETEKEGQPTESTAAQPESQDVTNTEATSKEPAAEVV